MYSFFFKNAEVTPPDKIVVTAFVDAEPLASARIEDGERLWAQIFAGIAFSKNAMLVKIADRGLRIGDPVLVSETENGGGSWSDVELVRPAPGTTLYAAIGRIRELTFEVAVN